VIKIHDLNKNRHWLIVISGFLSFCAIIAFLIPGCQTKGKEYAKNEKTIEIPINNVKLKLSTYPEKYAMTMSSTPGIRISAQYDGIADKVRYEANYGQLLTWDSTSGKINEYGQNVELPVAAPVYWSPLGNETAKNPEKIYIKASIFNKDILVAEKQVNIKYDGSLYYTAEASSD
jgi:hypothetical protein